MTVLLDTNILLRIAQPAHAQHQVALAATDHLGHQGILLHVVPQVLYEFWVVATRPEARNGLGMTAPRAEAELARIKAFFTLLLDRRRLFSEWEQLVLTHRVLGKNAHDARLVAAMRTHGLTHLLTFNTADFTRFPGITVVDPASVLPPTP